MRNRKPRRFRYRSNDRGRQRRNINGDYRPVTNSFSNGINRKNLNSNLNAEKLFEKYNALAKEALSAGDKTLSENYLQHADHFARVIDQKVLSHKNNSLPQNLEQEKKNSR